MKNESYIDKIVVSSFDSFSTINIVDFFIDSVSLNKSCVHRYRFGYTQTRGVRIIQMFILI